MIGGNMNENKLDINDKILNIIDNQDINYHHQKNNINLNHQYKKFKN